tara:strand:+ start:6398 stop:6907 length:510 start_codon:yes stop_codon:yes gene_type:complete
MSLIDKIIKVGKDKGVKEANLYGPAQACFENPTRGLTVVNKYAPLVIRDCAYVAKQYIPCFVVNSVSNIISELRSENVTEAECKEFLSIMDQTENPISKGYYEIYISIINKGDDYLTPVDPTPEVEAAPETDDYASVYGDYSTTTEVESAIVSDFVGEPLDKLKAILVK